MFPARPEIPINKYNDEIAAKFKVVLALWIIHKSAFKKKFTKYPQIVGSKENDFLFIFLYHRNLAKTCHGQERYGNYNHHQPLIHETLLVHRKHQQADWSAHRNVANCLYEQWVGFDYLKAKNGYITQCNLDNYSANKPGLWRIKFNNGLDVFSPLLRSSRVSKCETNWDRYSGTATKPTPHRILTKICKSNLGILNVARQCRRASVESPNATEGVKNNDAGTWCGIFQMQQVATVWRRCLLVCLSICMVFVHLAGCHWPCYSVLWMVHLLILVRWRA